jgi:hypothetical protein
MRKLLIVVASGAASVGLMAGPVAARDRGDDHEGSREERSHDRAEWKRNRSDDHRSNQEAEAEAAAWHAEQNAEAAAQAKAERKAEREARRAAKEAARQERKAAQAAATAAAATSGPIVEAIAEENGSLTIVHAIPDVVVDVYIDGTLVAPAVAFGTTQTIELPPGEIFVELRTAGAAATDPAILAQTFRIKPNVAKSFVAYLNENGEPEDDVFYDNITQNQMKAQLTVRHLAAAPAVDVYVDGELAFEGLSNPNQAKAFLDAGTYMVMITAAGDPATVVLPDTSITLEARTNTIVSAAGDFAAGTFSTVTLVLPMDFVAGSHSPSTPPSTTTTTTHETATS